MHTSMPKLGTLTNACRLKSSEEYEILTLSHPVLNPSLVPFLYGCCQLVVQSGLCFAVCELARVSLPLKRLKDCLWSPKDD